MKHPHPLHLTLILKVILTRVQEWPGQVNKTIQVNKPASPTHITQRYKSDLGSIFILFWFIYHNDSPCHWNTCAMRMQEVACKLRLGVSKSSTGAHDRPRGHYTAEDKRNANFCDVWPVNESSNLKKNNDVSDVVSTARSSSNRSRHRRIPRIEVQVSQCHIT